MNLFQGKTALIFDFDGTVADTFQLHDRAYRKAFEAYPGLEFRYDEYLGMSTREAIRSVMERNGIDCSEERLLELVKNKQQHANDAYRSALAFMPGAEAFIRLAHRSGLRLFVASSGSRRNVSAGVEALGLAPFFEGVITSEDVPYAKPDPAIFTLVLERYRIPAEAALVLEDARSGIQASVAAGIGVICVNEELFGAGPGFEGPVYYHTFSDLIQLFQQERNA